MLEDNVLLLAFISGFLPAMAGTFLFWLVGAKTKAKDFKQRCLNTVLIGVPILTVLDKALLHSRIIESLTFAFGAAFGIILADIFADFLDLSES